LRRMSSCSEASPNATCSCVASYCGGLTHATTFQVHKSWLIPTVLVLLVTSLIYGVVGALAAQPMP
jgi:hypothetical protein